MTNPDELLTPRQAAAMKKVHVKSVYRAIDEGRLVAEKRGGIYLIRQKEIERWRARQGRYKDSEG